MLSSQLSWKGLELGRMDWVETEGSSHIVGVSVSWDQFVLARHLAMQ